MRYEVVEEQGEWIVRSEGCEVARFHGQDAALSDVAQRLRAADQATPASVSVSYERRTGSR